MPPTLPTMGVKEPRVVPQPVLNVGDPGSRHLLQRSKTFSPLGTPSQSLQVELVPLQTPHASLPTVFKFNWIC